MSKAKPRIKYFRGRGWYCHHRAVLYWGTGSTPGAAYRDWKAWVSVRPWLEWVLE